MNAREAVSFLSKYLTSPSNQQYLVTFLEDNPQATMAEIREFFNSQMIEVSSSQIPVKIDDVLLFLISNPIVPIFTITNFYFYHRMRNALYERLKKRYSHNTANDFANELYRVKKTDIKNYTDKFVDHTGKPLLSVEWYHFITAVVVFKEKYRADLDNTDSDIIPKDETVIDVLKSYVSLYVGGELSNSPHSPDLIKKPDEKDKNKLAEELKRLDKKLALQAAIEQDNPQEIAALLEQDTKVDFVLIIRMTGLMYAAKLGRLECMKVFIQRGANLDLEVNCSSAISMAAKHQQEQAMLLLIEKGVSVPQFYYSSYAKLDVKLIDAVKNGDKDRVRFLINKLKMPVSEYYKKTTLLHVAAEHGQLEMVKLLIEELNILASFNDNDFNECLTIALEKHHLDIAIFLRALKPENHWDQFVPPEQLHEKLLEAVENNDQSVMRIIVQTFKFNVNFVNRRNKKTALIVAAEHHHADTVKLLLAWGALTDLADAYFFAAIDYAAKNNDKVIENLLLDAGADPAFKPLLPKPGSSMTLFQKTFQKTLAGVCKRYYQHHTIIHHPIFSLAMEILALTEFLLADNRVSDATITPELLDLINKKTNKTNEQWFSIAAEIVSVADVNYRLSPRVYTKSELGIWQSRQGWESILPDVQGDVLILFNLGNQNVTSEERQKVFEDIRTILYEMHDIVTKEPIFDFNPALAVYHHSKSLDRLLYLARNLSEDPQLHDGQWKKDVYMLASCKPTVSKDKKALCNLHTHYGEGKVTVNRALVEEMRFLFDGQPKTPQVNQECRITIQRP